MFRNFLILLCVFSVMLFSGCYAETAPDTDGDSVADDVDNCIEIVNPGQEDSDSDSLGDACDNCIYAYNPSQKDSNVDGVGDECPCPMEPLGPALMGLRMVGQYPGFATQIIFEKCEENLSAIHSLKKLRTSSVTMDYGDYEPDAFLGYGITPIVDGEILYDDIFDNTIEAPLGGILPINFFGMHADFPSALVDGDFMEGLGLPDISPNKIIFIHAGGDSNVNFMGLYITDLNSLLDMLPALFYMIDGVEFSENNAAQLVGLMLKPFLTILNNDLVQEMLMSTLDNALAEGFIDSLDSILPPIVVLLPADLMLDLLSPVPPQ